MNKVILLGRLTRDPEVRYTQSNEPLAIARFSVAVDRPYSRNNSQDQQTVDFIDCVCFGKRGENIGKFFRKGNRIAVTGRLQIRDWTDQSGQKRRNAEVVVDDFDFCESKASAAASAESPSQQYSGGNRYQPSANTGDIFDIDSSADDDDLPF